MGGGGCWGFQENSGIYFLVKGVGSCENKTDYGLGVLAKKSGPELRNLIFNILGGRGVGAFGVFFKISGDFWGV